MKKLYLVVAVAVLAGCGAKTATIEGLTFDPSICTEKTLTMPGGESVVYDAYEDIYFVTNVEDSTYQTLNFYVPKGAGHSCIPAYLCRWIYGGEGLRAESARRDWPCVEGGLCPLYSGSARMEFEGGGDLHWSSSSIDS